MAFKKQDNNNDMELTREDLFLLLESYKNNIEINTVLLEKTNLILEGNKNTAEIIQVFLKNLTEVIKEINEAKENQQKLYTESLTKMEKQHNGIKHQLYILYVSLGAIVLPLIKMMFDTITNHAQMMDLLQKITQR